MNFEIDKKRLLAASQRAANAAANAVQARVARLSASSISASGLEYDVTVALSDAPDGAAITVPAREFADRVALLGDGAVRVSSDDKFTVTLKSGKQKYTLRGASPDAFPSLAKPAGADATIGAEALRRMIARVSYAASPDATRPNTNAVLLEWRGQNVTMAATDGHRLAFATDTASAWTATMLLPLAAMRALSDKYDGDVGVSADGFWRFGPVTLMVRTIQAQFPPYQQVVPKTFVRNVTVPREPMVRALRATMVANPSRVELAFTNGALHFTASDHGGDASDAIEIDYAGPEHRTAFKPGYALDALGSIQDETVTIGLNGELDPLTFTAPGWTSLVMPVR